MTGLNGGILPNDHNGSSASYPPFELIGCLWSDNYLAELDLSSQVDLTDGANYKLHLIPSGVPQLKDQALWANQANGTLLSYGGSGVSDTPSDDAVWTYKIFEGLWEMQQGSVKPVRLAYGPYADAPEIQGAY
ncbi:uncharacterized protein BDW70DRAFT_18818 [Aspergillus foveolatus]|uniref:uncharacterized protein n=1 Tax=Aspergillus foveolatus TaxID=210207 RepID=UPI003CCDF5A1